MFQYLLLVIRTVTPLSWKNPFHIAKDTLLAQRPRNKFPLKTTFPNKQFTGKR